MKLSLERKLGHVHVRCGRVLRVAHDHQVTTDTHNALEPTATKRRAYDTKWVTAKIGDLAFELIAVKTDKVIGYSYLSGDAIRLHLYRQEAPQHWFTEARVITADADESLQRALESPTPNDFLRGVMAMKFAPCELVVFTLRCEDEETMRDAMDTWKRFYGLVPKEMTDDEVDRAPHPHLIALIDTLKKSRGPMATLHFEPTGQTSDAGCGGFQAALVCAANWPKFDPWALPEPSSAVG